MGDNDCGILQLSAEIYGSNIDLTGTSAGKDTMTDIRRDATTFNKYVKPGINKIWSDAASDVHVLHYRDPRIVPAASMPSVWADFCKWITTTIQPGEVVIVVAYNGPTCNLKWIWKLTQAPNSLYLIPDVMKLFLDPLWAINKYEGCKINPTKSKLDSLEICNIWK